MKSLYFPAVWLIYPIVILNFFTISFANAAVVYEQLPSIENVMLSDANTSYRAADDFTLSENQLISAITWLGAYNGATDTSSSSTFTINLYERQISNPHPSAPQLLNTDLIHSIYLDSSVEKIALAITVPNTFWELYEYTAVFDNPLDLAAGNYWLSIVESENLASNWYWAFGVDGNGLLSSNGGDFYSDTLPQGGSNHYFSLTPVPVPGTLIIFLSGLFGIAIIRRYLQSS